jgi:hypothetical protein
MTVNAGALSFQSAFAHDRDGQRLLRERRLVATRQDDKLTTAFDPW